MSELDYDKYLQQMIHWQNHDIYEQTKEAEKHFNTLLQKNKDNEKERYVQNKIGIGHTPLSHQNIQAIQQLQAETIIERDASFRKEMPKLYNQPIIPIGFNSIDKDYKHPHKTELQKTYKLTTTSNIDRSQVQNFKLDNQKKNMLQEQPQTIPNSQDQRFIQQNKQNEIYKYEYSVQNPCTSDFTPVAQSLMHYRKQNLDLFRKAINSVIYRNRAQKMVRSIRKALNLDKEPIQDSSSQQSNQYLQYIISNEGTPEHIDRIGIDTFDVIEVDAIKEQSINRRLENDLVEDEVNASKKMNQVSGVLLNCLNQVQQKYELQEWQTNNVFFD